MIRCPYLTCRGIRAHAGPHLFEQPDIDKLLAKARRSGFEQAVECIETYRLAPHESGVLDEYDVVESWNHALFTAAMHIRTEIDMEGATSS